MAKDAEAITTELEFVLRSAEGVVGFNHLLTGGLERTSTDEITVTLDTGEELTITVAVVP